MAKALVQLVKTRFPGAILETHAQHGDETIVLDPARWKEVAQFLRDAPQADMQVLSDLTAVDYPDREPRFEIVAHLYSMNKGHRLRIKTRTGDEDGDDAEIDSLTDIWASANWLERECWDMF